MKNLLQNFKPSDLLLGSDETYSSIYKGNTQNFFRHAIAGAINNGTGYPLYTKELDDFREREIKPYREQLHNYHAEILAKNFKFTPENIDLILTCFYLCLHPETITDEIVTLFDCESSDLEQVRDIIIEAKKNNEYEELNELMK